MTNGSELFNTTGSSINLTGWRIVDDAGAQTNTLSGILQARLTPCS